MWRGGNHNLSLCQSTPPPLSNLRPNPLICHSCQGKSHVGRSVGRNEKRPERVVFIEVLAEFTTPTPMTARQCVLNIPLWPRQTYKGNSTSKAMLTRNHAVDHGPNCCDAMRMKTNEEPQIVPSATNSGNQRCQRKSAVTTSCLQ